MLSIGTLLENVSIHGSEMGQVQDAPFATISSDKNLFTQTKRYFCTISLESAYESKRKRNQGASTLGFVIA
jgi:hypothetical protein